MEPAEKYFVDAAKEMMAPAIFDLVMTRAIEKLNNRESDDTDELIERMAELWINSGGNEKGFSFNWRRILHQIKAKECLLK